MHRHDVLDKLTVTERSDDIQTSCRYCGSPIRHYAHIGWIDVTPSVRGGTYDMCPANGQTAEHLPHASREHS